MMEFFKANETKRENQVSTLLSLISTDTFKLLRDLCFPEHPSRKTFEELSNLLKQQYCSKVVVWRERRKFNEATQEQEESVTEWYASVKSLAVDCNFGSNLSLFLKDKFITGIKRGQVFDRICEEEEKVTRKMVDIARKKRK
ncbi:hypothetical protein NQ314_004901 [Rhamnusium bicolor]|uniref:Retrotransposon gag domain-containing protein n=1 Tax=Rhamnusium bicolor TaxID=1586634 RepID=A0AAV8ZHX0_9CUCU|nr:hypothetical protein NQ314_004901 [Rhamnusium bicolor]